MKSRACIFFVLFLPAFLSAQEARVVSFKHTVRWLNESNFPNYFQDPQVLDSICKDIREDLMLKLNASEITFPDHVEYRMITGFGKPKDEMLKASKSPGYMIDLFSFLTRATVGFDVNWSVTMIIRKDGKVILQSEVIRVIENVNAAAYLTPQRWWPAGEFRSTFRLLTREAMGLEKENPDKVFVGAIGEKEEEVRLWFPNLKKDVFITRGALESGGNTSAQLIHEEDTILQFVLKHKLDKSVQAFSLSPLLADLFVGLTGWETFYKINVKERRRALLEANQGEPLLFQMDWIDEYTVSRTLGEVEYRTVVPMIGVFYEDELMVGKFVYQKISETKIYTYTFPFRPAVIHEVKGILHGHEFTAEYNEFIGQAEIKMNNETIAVMIFQNWNPENINAYMSKKISENKKTISGSMQPIGAPKLENDSKQEWYTLFMNEDATTQDQLNSIQILVCLFFSIGVDQEANSEEWSNAPR